MRVPADADGQDTANGSTEIAHTGGTAASAEPVRDGFEVMWGELRPVGRVAASGGYQRYAWSAADLECRAWFREQAANRSLVVETDRNGNLWAWWGAPGPGAVVTGSHLDSVPDGGAFDGPLGVISSFAAVDLLRAEGFQPARPVAIVAFCDEEGARFGVSCVGSRLMTGVLDAQQARELRDPQGRALADVMAEAGHDPDQLGRDAARLAGIHAFVELHVEQGRALVDSDTAVGVGDAVWAHGRWRIDLAGEGNHAGTTLLPDRRDPVLPLAAAVLAARCVADRHGAVATIGRLRIEPNGTNAIASAAHAWLDARAADDDTVDRLVEEISGELASAAEQHRVRMSLTRESWSPLTVFDAALRSRLADVVARVGGAGERPTIPILPTGAGHDAAILAAEVPTAMLFVRNPTGVSHSPAEHADEADCLAGVTALAGALRDLTCR